MSFRKQNATVNRIVKLYDTLTYKNMNPIHEKQVNITIKIIQRMIQIK